MNIIVTGGAGFIGSNFINYMKIKYPKYNLICIDNLTYAGNIDNLKNVMNKENFKFIKCDICNREKIYGIFEDVKPDIVINFAAESHVDRSITTPEIFLQTNIIGTSVLLDACRKYNIKRYHQVSTDEVYGDLPLDRPDLLFSEQNNIVTSSPYSASKASADLLVQAYHRTYNLPITISRCSNNYGKHQFPEKLIPLMIINAIKGEELPVYGKGDNVRDWIHVDDHCEAIDKIIHNGIIGEVYNIGGNNEINNITIVKSILDILGKNYDLIEFVPDRLGHDKRYAIDGNKIKNELGFVPKYDFKEGLRYTIKWYCENREWWENILNGKYVQLNNQI